MAKDWEYHKNNFMLNAISNMNKALDWTQSGTPIEKIIGCKLVEAQMLYGYLYFNVSFQERIEEYTLDFLVKYSSPTTNFKVIIECDGHEFHEKTREQVSKDKKRDRYFSKNGFTIFRYSGSEIVNNPNQVKKDLWDLFYPPELKEGVEFG